MRSITKNNPNKKNNNENNCNGNIIIKYYCRIDCWSKCNKNELGGWSLKKRMNGCSCLLSKLNQV